MVLVIKAKNKKVAIDTSKPNKSYSKKNKLNKKVLSQKILKRPKAKGPTPVSAHKTLRGFADSSVPMVREVEEKEIVQDNRSQFFKREMEKENKWLS